MRETGTRGSAMTSVANETEFIEAVLDLPVRYIDRSRAYYLALGYDNPYRWAQHREAPFSRPAKPVSESRVALVSTAAPYNRDAGDQGPWALYNARAKFTNVYSMPIDPPPDVRISHVGYDRKHTSAEDINTYFPLERMKEAAGERRIGRLNERFYGVPTLRSQRLTIERDAPQVLDLCREDGIEAAVLVAT